MKVEELNQREVNINLRLTDAKRVIFDMDHSTKEEIAMASKWKDYLEDARNFHENELQERVLSARAAVSDFKSCKASLEFKKQMKERSCIKDEARRRILEGGLRKLENEERKLRNIRESLVEYDKNLQYFLIHMNLEDVDKGILKYQQVMKSNDILTDRVSVLMKEIQRLIDIKNHRKIEEEKEVINRDTSYRNIPQLIRSTSTLIFDIQRKAKFLCQIMIALKSLHYKIDKFDILQQLGPSLASITSEFDYIESHTSSHSSALNGIIQEAPASLLLLESKLSKAEVIISQSNSISHAFNTINNHSYLITSSICLLNPYFGSTKSGRKEVQNRMVSLYNSHFPKTRILTRTKTNESIKDMLSGAVSMEFEAIQEASKSLKHGRRSLSTVYENRKAQHTEKDQEAATTCRSGYYEFEDSPTTIDTDTTSSTKILTPTTHKLYTQRESLLKGVASTARYKAEDKKIGLPEIEKSLKHLVSQYNSIKRDQLKSHSSLHSTCQEISHMRLSLKSSTPKPSLEPKSPIPHTRTASLTKPALFPSIKSERAFTLASTLASTRSCQPSPSITLTKSSRRMPDYVARLKLLS